MEKKIKLLRCPFCGGKAELVNMGIKDCDEPFEDWDVECQKCHTLCILHGEGSDGEVATQEEAAERWNRRVKPLTSVDGSAELEAIIEKYSRISYLKILKGKLDDADETVTIIAGIIDELLKRLEGVDGQGQM